MRTYVINENKDNNGQVVGSALWAGRGWLHFNDEGGHREKSLRLEWYFGKHSRHTMTEVRTDFVWERELKFAFGLFGLFCIFFTILLPYFPSWSYEHGDRQIGVRIMDGGIWIDLWVNDEEWRKSDPFWKKHIVIHPIDILFGRKQHERRDLSTTEFVVPMIEADYPATVTFFESTWKRPRWPQIERITRADIELVKPIPVPGKGENSWDIDDDAIHGMTVPCTTVKECIAAVKASANRTREKYGGRNWLPEVDEVQP